MDIPRSGKRYLVQNDIQYWYLVESNIRILMQWLAGMCAHFGVPSITLVIHITVGPGV